MKNLLLLIFSILTCCKLLSQTTDENVFTVRTISKEEMVVTGSFQVDVQITANLNCTIDNLNTVNQGSFLSVSPFNTQSAQSSLSVGTYLNANQTMTLTIYITHSTSNLPYYPEDIGVKIKGHTNTTVFEAYAGSKIYFTPYNSVEIWDRIDYRKLPRVWAVKASTPPSRVFIPRDSIPVSTKPVNAQIDYDWQKYYQVAHVDGLPYLIQMAAVHPDTIKYYKDLDSITEWNSEYGKGVFGRTFEGTVSGRLRANYIPDGQTTPINMSLEGVHVAAYDEDITYDDKLGGTHTDANGNFSISYSKWQSKLELDKIELYVQYWSENLGYDIEVEIDHDGIVGLNVAPESDHTWIGQVGTSYTGNLGDISIEGIYEGSFKTLNWAYKAYKFCKNNLGNLNSSFTSSLDILTERNISGSGQFNTVKGNRISLSRNSDLHEGTIWHEFGHFLMHKLQGGYNPGNTIDYDRWGDSHINAAWSEGWADGFAMIVDINYRYYDSESGFRRNAFLNDPVPFEERAIYNATIGFKSVYQIGCTLLDLYDGPNNFLNLPNIATSVYNDESSTGYNSITPNAKDDVSLPFEMLCNAMLFNDHVGQFYTALQNQQTEECIRAKIKRVFTFNGITNPVNAYTNQIAQLNSDFFYTIAYIDGRTFNMDVAVLNTSFNYGATSTYQSAEITDDLKLANGITLGINNNMPIGFGGSGNPSQHTNMYVHACGNTITVENGGVLELGGTNKGGELTLKDGATLILKQGSKLKLNLNAKLLLNNATLVYENGADITISDNAFIEIGEGSKIVIGNNATFSWTGDGYLKFNRNATSTFVPNIIASSSNNGATFDQVNAGGSTKKVIEITKGSLAVDKDIALFKLTKGSIFMGPNAIVDVKSKLLLEGIKMKPLNGAAYTGIRVYGQQEDPYLHTCVIDNAFIGLDVISNGGGSSNAGIRYASVKYTNFNNCYMGIRVTGKSAQITGGKYWGNQTGIFLSGVERKSTISNITANDNRSAIDVVGTGYDMLETKYCNIYNNMAAGAFMVKSTIRPTCSQINNNYPTSRPFDGCNILLREYSTLNVEPYGLTGQDGGKSSIASASSHSVVCREANGLYLHHGKTNFYTDASNNMSFYGTLQPWYMFMIGTPTILAHKNIWNPSGNPIVNGVDYDISNNWGSITIDDANPISPSDVDCIVAADWDDKPSQLINPCPKLEEEGDDLVIIDALAKIYQQTPDYVSAISDFAGVVTKSYQTIYVPPVTPPGQDPPSQPAEYVDEFSDCHKIIAFAYETMLQALGEGIGNGSIENSGEITDPVKTVIDAQNALKDYYMQYENGSRKVFEIDLEQALIYRLINNRQTALEKLQALHDDAETEVEQNLLSYYECLVMNEIIIETSEDNLNYDELNDCVTFLNLPDVELEPTSERPEDPVWEEGYGKTGPTHTTKNDQPAKIQLKKTAKTIEDQIRIFPNPAVNTINVKLPSGITADEIRIVDITGRTVKTFNRQFADTGILDFQLEGGIYFIEINNGEQTISRKKVMINR